MLIVRTANSTRQFFFPGVQYVIDSLYGNCSVTELTASFNDFIQRPSYLLPPEMRHPIALLEVNYSSMVYQGKVSKAKQRECLCFW